MPNPNDLSPPSHLSSFSDWVIITLNPKTGEIIQQDEYEYALERFIASLRKLRRFSGIPDEKKGQKEDEKGEERRCNEDLGDVDIMRGREKECGGEERANECVERNIGLGINPPNATINTNTNTNTTPTATSLQPTGSSNPSSNPRSSPPTDIDFADLDGLSDPEFRSHSRSTSRSWSTDTNTNTSSDADDRVSERSSEVVGDENDDDGKCEESEEVERLCASARIGDDERETSSERHDERDGDIIGKECDVDNGVREGMGDVVPLAAAAHAVILAWLWAMEHWGWIE